VSFQPSISSGDLFLSPTSLSHDFLARTSAYYQSITNRKMFPQFTFGSSCGPFTTNRQDESDEEQGVFLHVSRPRRDGNIVRGVVVDLDSVSEGMLSTTLPELVGFAMIINNYDPKWVARKLKRHFGDSFNAAIFDYYARTVERSWLDPTTAKRSKGNNGTPHRPNKLTPEEDSSLSSRSGEGVARGKSPGNDEDDDSNDDDENKEEDLPAGLK
jgi:hypothetical protein